MRSAALVALVAALSACAPPAPYRGDIPIQRAGLMARMRLLCSLGMGDGEIAGAALGAGALELGLELGDHLGIEERLGVLLAEQLGEQAAIDRQGLGAALGRRHVALIEIGGDVGEHQRAGKWRGLLAVHIGDAHLAARHRLEQLGEGGHVEDVLQAFAVGLDHDGKVGKAAGPRRAGAGP